MAKNEPAAMERALKAFAALEPADKKVVVSRLTKGEPKMGLAGMARVEEIHAELSDGGKAYLLPQLVALVDKPAVKPQPKPAPTAAATAAPATPKA